jgi:hypothetical protein
MLQHALFDLMFFELIYIEKDAIFEAMMRVA